jgi:energy-coupling factor transporter ATP-binding protein EcfA2
VLKKGIEMSMYDNFSKGSEWRKWDLHFHTPSSHDYHDKSVTDEDIIKILHENNISIVCVTDHNTIDTQRVRNLQTLGLGKVVVLPGIEFCSELGGSEAIHFIGIFSENSDIGSIWTKLQGRLNLTPDDILKRGGHEKIQCDLVDTCDIIHKLGGITSIHAGTKTNTIENIKNTLLVKMDQKRRILSECIDILELGKPDDANAYNSIVFKSINHILPMIISSDNHNIRNYEIKSSCWIKADPTFEGLKQILYEPQNRVFIGIENPSLHRENCINSILVEKKAWFPQNLLPLNNGLVTIIGARGSGKTALLDFVSLGARAYYRSKASFLNKAKKEVQPLTVKIEYDGNKITQYFDPEIEPIEPLALYLSQQFVENLCSEDGSTERLQAEIERFIFESIDGVERIGTSNFQELKYALCNPFETSITAYKNRISSLNNEITRIYHLQTIDLPSKEKEKIKLENELTSFKSKLPILDKTIQNKSLQEYEKLNTQKINLGNELKIEWSQITKLKQIKTDIILFNKTIIEKNQFYKNELFKLDIDEKILSRFGAQYHEPLIMDISKIIDSRKKVFYDRYGSKENPNENTYLFLAQLLTNIQQKMNQYTENEKRYLDISQRIEAKKIELLEIEKLIVNIKSLNINALQDERLKIYKQIFEEILKIKETLESLYRPLTEQLKRNKQEKQLGFFVKIDADIKSWAKQGEELIDLRRVGELSSNKNLYTLAYNKMFNVWVNCELNHIEKAMADFTNDEARKMSRILINTNSMVKLADWLFSTDHIKISYEMTFNGIPLKLLSPGTKGILLMLLYLGVDKNDIRPLLIDQPEDNLDPESVYSVLVPYFVEAKKRRQIIMVTHNSNLVIATDSDQVIIANCKTEETGSLPIFTYSGGGLENQEIVTRICDILEGGKEAFIKRALRYHIDFKSKHNVLQNNSGKKEE